MLQNSTKRLYTHPVEKRSTKNAELNNSCCLPHWTALCKMAAFAPPADSPSLLSGTALRSKLFKEAASEESYGIGQNSN